MTTKLMSSTAMALLTICCQRPSSSRLRPRSPAASPEYRTQTLFKGIAMISLIIGFGAAPVLAASIFDDFEDGNAEDGLPITWIEGMPDDATRTVENGSYVLSGTGIVSSTFDELKSTNFDPPMHSTLFSNAILETQLRITSAASSGFTAAGLFGRSPSAAAYFGAITPQGQLILGESSPSGVISVAGQVTTGLRPVEHDVKLRLEMFHEDIRLWAWAEGDSMPLAPQLSFSDDTLFAGSPGVFLNSDNMASVAYRYFSAHSIPEPRSFVVLLLCGITALAVRSLRRRRRCAGVVHPM